MLTKFAAPFLLIQRNGGVIEFADLRALACAVRAARITISEHHVVYITTWNHSTSIYNGEWIVRDDAGRIVREAEVTAARDATARGYRLRLTHRHAMQVHAASLGLPIPGTGGRGSYGDYFRSPACHRALRAHAAMRTDERDDPRPTGRIPRPPTSYDDIQRSDREHRTWKRHRKTQWAKPHGQNPMGKPSGGSPASGSHATRTSRRQ